MRIFLMIDGPGPQKTWKRLSARPPFPEADHARVPGACPACGKAEPSDPEENAASYFKVAGTGKHASADDRAYEATAVALCCDRYVGILRAEPNTLFGVREDEAIAGLGVRIY